MEKVKHQHYVPRMYLKRFGCGDKEDKKITVLKLDEGTVLENRRAENFASANFFYDTNREQLVEALYDELVMNPELFNSEKLSDEQFVEHALAREEAVFSNMLNELQEDLSKVHESPNTSLMIIFLHSLAFRTKYFRDQMNDVNNMTTEVLNTMCDNLGLDGDARRKVIEKNCTKGKGTQLYQIMGLQPALKTMKMLLENYDWYEAVNNTELDFVISDDPAHNVRLASNDICIPISCNKAIIFRIKDKSAPVISKDMPVDGVINLSLNSVVTYNIIQLQSGQKFLFGTSKAIKFMKKIWELEQAIRKRNTVSKI